MNERYTNLAWGAAEVVGTKIMASTTKFFILYILMAVMLK